MEEARLLRARNEEYTSVTEGNCPLLYPYILYSTVVYPFGACVT